MNATLQQVVFHIVKSAGPNGISVKQIQAELRKSHPHWKPDSVSPSLTGLVRAGLLLNRGSRTDRTLHVVKGEPTARDWDKARKGQIGSGASRKSAVAVDSHLGILIAIGKDHTETLTLDQARDLYNLLHGIFGKKE